MKTANPKGVRHLATLCHTANCCPTVSLDERAGAEQQVVIADDFGNRVQMSRAHLADFAAQAKAGAFDSL